MTISTDRDTRASLSKTLQYLLLTIKFPPMQFFLPLLLYTLLQRADLHSGEKSQRSFSALENFSVVFCFQIIARAVAAEANSCRSSTTAQTALKASQPKLPCPQHSATPGAKLVTDYFVSDTLSST